MGNIRVALTRVDHRRGAGRAPGRVVVVVIHRATLGPGVDGAGALVAVGGLGVRRPADRLLGHRRARVAGGVVAVRCVPHRQEQRHPLDGRCEALCVVYLDQRFLG